MSRSTLILQLGNTLGTAVGDVSRSTLILRSGAGRCESVYSNLRLGRTVMFDRRLMIWGVPWTRWWRGPDVFLTWGLYPTRPKRDSISFGIRAGRGLHGSQVGGARMPSWQGGALLTDDAAGITWGARSPYSERPRCHQKSGGARSPFGFNLGAAWPPGGKGNFSVQVTTKVDIRRLVEVRRQDLMALGSRPASRGPVV